MENRSIAFWTIIVMIIAGLAYGIWTGFLNKGTLSVGGGAPFTVTLDEEEPVVCQVSPCSFKVATGEHLVHMEKPGYLEMVKNIEVVRGEETIVAADLQKIVSVVKAQKVTIPAVVANPFVLKTSAEKQALVKKSRESEAEEVIAYFARPLKSAKTYTVADASMVWVTDSAASLADSAAEASLAETIIYQIDVAKKTRHQLWQTSEKIMGLMPSTDGKFLAVLTPKNIELFNTHTRSRVTMSATISSEKLVTWAGDGDFFYVDRVGSVMYLKQTSLKNPLKPNTIQAWESEEDTIMQIWFEPARQSVFLKGEKDGYQVAL